MPCFVDGHDSPKDNQHREAAKLRIILFGLQIKPVPEDLGVARPGEYYSGQVEALCGELRALGGETYLKELVAKDSRNPDVHELYAWWMKHAAWDMRREQQEREARLQRADRARLRKQEREAKEARITKLNSLMGELVESVKKQ